MAASEEKYALTPGKFDFAPDVIAKYRKKFEAMDLNKDGILTMREMATVGKVFGYKLSKEEMQDLFGKRDLDDSGGINFEEFMSAMVDRAKKAKSLAPIKEAFHAYDKKKKGYVTCVEALPILSKELGFDEVKTDALIAIYDINKDYRLSIKEFIGFYEKVEELKKQVKEAFEEFDANKDGFVDKAEASKLLKSKGFDDEEIDTLFDKSDKDQDGKLDYQEFAIFWDIPVS